MRRPVLFLTVGLPGVGKTTRAREIASAHGALRLTPDEWMAPLFGESDAGGRRDILEGRMIWVAHEVLLGGGSVVLDFGCWSPQERYAIRAMTEGAGADFRLVHLELPEAERRARADLRWQTTPESTFEMSTADHEQFLEHFVQPDTDELSLGPMPSPPEGWATWGQWAAQRWPTLPDLSAETSG